MTCKCQELNAPEKQAGRHAYKTPLCSSVLTQIHPHSRVLQRCWSRAPADFRGVDVALLMICFFSKSSYAACWRGYISNLETMPYFYLKIWLLKSSDFGPLRPSDSRIEKKTVGLCTFGLRKQTLSFLWSKNINLQLEIEPHRKQPCSFIFAGDFFL